MPLLLSLDASIIDFLDPQTLLVKLGSAALIGVLIIIFAECGLLIGFFLPGDSLLFITGLFVAQGFMPQPIWLVAVLLVLAAVAGNLCGYWIGRKAGPAMFNRPDSKLFHQTHVDKTHSFFDKYGARAIVLARFVPIIRTFITVMAGVGKMDFRTYAVFSTIGGILWAAGLTLLGYFLGNVSFIKNNIEIIVILIVLISIVPILIEFLRHRREKQREASA